MAAKAKDAVESYEFKGRVCTFDLAGPGSERRWILHNLPFENVRKFCEVEPYDDRKGTGWQREQSVVHCRHLHRAMREGAYTPAPMAASVTPEIEAGVRYDGEGNAGFTATTENRLSLIDGGHRLGAYELELGEATKAKDDDRVRKVLGQAVSLQIYLDSKYRQTDFQNLQRGKSVDRGLIKLMELNNKQIKPEVIPFFAFAKEVCSLLARNKDSHVYGQVRFAGGEPKIRWDVLCTPSASDLACSFTGSAKVAMKHGKKPKFVADTMVEAWKVINQETARGEGDEFPSVLQTDKLLYPSVYGGKRGATLFITCIGNMLLWRKLFLGVSAAGEEETRHLADTVDAELDRPAIGWAGDDKRVLAGKFARAYFRDLVWQPGEDPGRDTPRVRGVDGVPLPLVETLSAGAFKVVDAYKSFSKGAVPEDPDDVVDQADSTPAVKGKRGRRPKGRPLVTSGSSKV